MMKNYKIKKHWVLALFVGFLCIGLSRGQADAAAKALLDKASSTMSSYKNVAMDFDYVLDNRAEDVKQEMSGDVLLEGDKYIVNLFGTQQMFDGKKTYTIIPENEEVNISEMDVDQDNAFTPSKFYSFYESGYGYEMDELKTVNGKKVQFVKLTPIDSESEISIILVGIEVKTNHIYQIIEVGTNKTRTILTASNIRTNQDLDGSVFVFDEKKYEELNYMINK